MQSIPFKTAEINKKNLYSKVFKQCNKWNHGTVLTQSKEFTIKTLKMNLGCTIVPFTHW